MYRSIIETLPKLHFISHFTYSAQPGMHYPLHHHSDQTELLFIVDGQAKYVIDGKSYGAEKHHFVLFQQGLWHEEWSLPSEGIEFFCLSFSDLQLSGLPPNYLLDPEKPAVFHMPSHTSEALAMIREMYEEMSSGAPESSLIAEQQLAILIARLCRHLYYAPHAAAKEQSNRNHAVKLAQRFIAEHYNKPLSLAEIARSVWTSPSYLSHFFKEATGMSPIQYTIRLRMDAAKHLLQTTDDAVEHIAERVGYSSATSFHNLFKREICQSPGEYRKSAAPPAT
ncbi:AraC-like DNA-binding protein [Paenibacillus endophyticus]|uniref:AraC-like DNA-binding protein n=1 Tax=Paenibacillus endophyticus TaxID=1294268 RepID=A0A7W5C580_9BACL|nr:AraC family transcriptional regulator [Paenibacillus endophyticus]MBB3151412.1 AraC-like DNA-binding protein [Paenibacillus endophyticus]